MTFCLGPSTIIAQCSPHGRGAIGLIRLSGPQAVSIADRISVLPSRKKLAEQATHTIHYGHVATEAGQVIDQVLFLLMRAPQTFTGCDTVEITCHNNQFVIEKIISRALAAGALPARAGEFCEQAVENGKIDLLQAEAINELIHAHSQHGLEKSLAQLNGSLSSWIANIEQKILEALTLSEASFEFLDDEMEFGQQIQHLLTTILETLDQLLVTFDQQKYIKDGIRIALIGSVNVGKSSLFNALVRNERAIVTPIAGTTRDIIEAGIYKNSFYWTIVDTAGIRESNDVIEQEGIRRSYEQAHQADVILLVTDGPRALSAAEEVVYRDLFAQYDNKTILVKSKDDLVATNTTPSFFAQNIAISAYQPASIERLELAIQQKIDALVTTKELPFLINNRQHGILVSMRNELGAINASLQKSISYELLSHNLNTVLTHITHLTGKSISEQTMDSIFRTFCIGK